MKQSEYVYIIWSYACSNIGESHFLVISGILLAHFLSHAAKFVYLITVCSSFPVIHFLSHVAIGGICEETR